MEKKLKHWKEDCTFAKLAMMHTGYAVGFAAGRVWEIYTVGIAARLRIDGLDIARVDLESGTFTTPDDSLLKFNRAKMLVDRINKGKQDETCQKYMDAIESLYRRLAQRANERLRDVLMDLEEIH